METTFRTGEFEQTQVGIMQFVASDFASESKFFGLNLNETLFIAHVRDGVRVRHLHLTRPFMMRTSSGASFSVSRDDGVYQDPRGDRLLRGGVFDRYVDDGGNLVLRGQSGFWAGEVPQTVEASFGERFSWSDSGQVQLSGRLLGPGLQTYVTSRQGDAVGAMLDTNFYYAAEGKMFGEKVSGFVCLENFFLPGGQILSDNAVRRRWVAVWNAFVHEFEDGTVQYGQIAYGFGPFKWANIVDGDRHIFSPVVSVKAETGSAGLTSRVEYQLANGEAWEFVSEKNGALTDMIALVAKRGGNTQVHKGHVGRVGETRVRRSWYSIQERFPDRLAAAAREVDDRAISGF